MIMKEFLSWPKSFLPLKYLMVKDFIHGRHKYLIMFKGLLAYIKKALDVSKIEGIEEDKRGKNNIDRITRFRCDLVFGA